MTRDFRPRYILFTIDSDEELFPIPRHLMISTLRSYCHNHFSCSLKEKNLFLTRFNGKKGIVRCEHTDKQETIILLTSIRQIDTKKVTVKTIATSGTIKSLVKKHDTGNVLTK
jgi:RNase P/RNase MRP subunit POP5